MASPSSALSTQRPDLAGSFMEFDLAMDQAGFIAQRVLPVLPVAKQAGNFGKIPVEQLLQIRETKRAPGSHYNSGTFTFTPATYACEEHGWEEPVDDAEAMMYREYFSLEQMAAMRAFRAVLENYEKRVAAAIFNATTWTGSALTTAITNEWDDAPNAVPLTDVEAAVKKVWNASGLWPNALIINRRVFRNLRNVKQITDRIQYSGFTDPRAGMITEAALAAAFDLDFIIVAGSAKNTALEGQAATIAPIWSDEYAMVCKIAVDQDIRSPCIGRTFHWDEDGSAVGGTVETYRDESKRSDIVRVRHQVDEAVLYVEAGHLLSNVTT